MSSTRNDVLGRGSWERGVLAAVLWLTLGFQALLASQAFTYQGRLTDSSRAANGNYELHFRLHDALSGGNPVGSALIRHRNRSFTDFCGHSSNHKPSVRARLWPQKTRCADLGKSFP